MDKLLIIAYVLATVSGLVLLKLGTTGTGLFSIVDGKFSLTLSSLAILGILFYGVSFLLYIALISKFSLGYIIPLTTAFVYILVFLASYFIFKEGFTPLKIVAIAMIIGGVILLNVTPTIESKAAKSDRAYDKIASPSK